MFSSPYYGGNNRPSAKRREAGNIPFRKKPQYPAASCRIPAAVLFDIPVCYACILHGGGRADDVPPVEVAPLEAVYEHLARRDIGRHRDIVDVAESQNVVILRLVGLRGERVAEEKQKIYTIIEQIAAERSKE